MGLLSSLRKKSKALILVAALSSSLSACQASIQEVKEPPLTRRIIREIIKINIRLDEIVKALNYEIKEKIKYGDELQKRGELERAFSELTESIRWLTTSEAEIKNAIAMLPPLIKVAKEEKSPKEDIEELEMALERAKEGQEILQQLLMELDRIREEIRKKLKKETKTIKV